MKENDAKKHQKYMKKCKKMSITQKQTHSYKLHDIQHILNYFLFFLLETV